MSYRIAGNKLLDNGQEIHLLGVNVLGMELKEACIFGLGWGSLTLKEFVAAIKGVGFNAVRLPITSRTISNVEIAADLIGAEWITGNKFLAGKKSMEVCDELVKELEAQGIRYVFDLHYLEAGFPGSIPPLWYTKAYPESKWIEDLTKLAERYKSSPGFIGIDLRNEPNQNSCTWGSGDLKTDWRLASERAFKAISAVNDNIIIWIEAIGAGAGVAQLVANPPSIPKDRVSYSMHLYGPSVWQDFGEGFKNSDFPRSMPIIWDRMIGSSAVNFNVNIGEFGGKNIDRDKLWQDEFFSYLKSRRIDSFFWAWQGSASGDTGGILTDGGFRNQDAQKVKLVRSLITERTNFMGEASKPTQPPAVPPPVIPPVITTSPSAAIQAKDVVRFITGEGPKMVVQSVTQKDAKVAYMSPYTLSTIPLELLVKV